MIDAINTSLSLAGQIAAALLALLLLMGGSWLLGVLYGLHAAEDLHAADVYTKETRLPVQAPPTPAGITVVNIVVNQKR